MENETRIELLRRCAEEGGEQAWNELIRQFGQHLRRTVRRSLRRSGLSLDADGVEEMIQEVYCRLLEHDGRRLRQFRGNAEPSLAAYLAKIAESAVFDQVRHRRAAKRGGDRLIKKSLQALAAQGFDLDAHDCPEQRAIDRDRVRHLIRKFRSAKGPRNRGRDLRILRLALLEGWTSREIAAVLPEPRTSSSVDSLLYRLRQRLAIEGEAVKA